MERIDSNRHRCPQPETRFLRSSLRQSQSQTPPRVIRCNVHVSVNVMISPIRFSCRNSLLQQAVADLDQAVALAPAGHDVMVTKVLLKAKQEAETAFRQSQCNQQTETSKT